MVTVETTLRLVGGLALLLTNGFFVTTEFALTRVRQFSKSEFSGHGLRRAWEMTERLEIYLSGCQVGITVSSIGLGVVAEPALTAVVDPVLGAVGVGATGTTGHTTAAVVIAFALMNLLHVVVGEQAPTYLGIERTKTVARYGATPLYWWTKLMSPVIVLSDRVAKLLLGLFGVDISRSWTEVEGGEGGDAPATRGDLRRRMGETLKRSDLSDERRDEVLNALAIGEIPVEAIMNGRESIVALSTTDTVERNLDRMVASPHLRFPLVGASLEAFEGVVYTPDVLRHLHEDGETTLSFTELTTSPMTVSPETPVSDVIDRFQRANQELALVVDDGRVVGLVTVTDAFEQIIGELEDPMDVASA